MTKTEIFNRIMEYEGGGGTHRIAGDPGGTTKWGVSQRAHPDVDVPSLTRGEAFEIFERDYFNPVRADQLPEPLRLPVVDLAFNTGVGMAIGKLQQSVNLCKQAVGRSDWLVVDGIIGPATLGALDDVAPSRLARVLLAYRIEHYVTLAELGRAKFIHGWLRRAVEIHHYGGNA